MAFESHVAGLLLEHYATTIFTFFVAYGTILGTYRLVFSPLANFPGPKIAAATGWFEFYHDYFRRGKYVFEIKKMHDKYGEFSSVDDRTWGLCNICF